MRNLSTEVYERCGCAMLTTHGLPCGCNIFTALQGGVGIYIDLVHPFWRTLEIAEGAEIPEVVAESAQVTELFRSLVDDVLARDIAVIRDISRIVHDELHPEHAGYEEPEPNLTRRGRPRRQRNSTTRNLSLIEHVRNTGPRTISNQGASSSGNPQSRSSLGSYMSIDLIPPRFKESLPDFMLQYIRGYRDVIPNGNCGFRCAEEFFLGDQERYGEIRSTVVGEIKKLDQYKRVYLPETISNASYRIDWRGGMCGQEHWMITDPDLWPIATHFNAVVVIFGIGGESSLIPSATNIPLENRYEATRPTKEIVLAFVNKCHYIILEMAPDCPLPSIPHRWRALADYGFREWESRYETRIQGWTRYSDEFNFRMGRY
ncbi:uncharacterized protein [Spinacia oleracea]|uniref:OTU domain-containing protein n=1 Tax=Spinacia oleracea TaxID=3562 RepID=A0ABM3QXJ1_SPIOL|nr:uncharacterized protein LOC130463075 [Spinacia oleracea]